MIAAASPSSHEAKFIALLPAIRRQARLAFRGETAERRGELRQAWERFSEADQPVALAAVA